MRILIIGAAGMIGRKLTAQILARGGIGGREVSHLTLHESSLAKRRGVKLARVKIGKRGRRAARATNHQSRRCI